MLAIMPIFRGNPRKLGLFPAELPVDVLDDHIAIVGTARFGQKLTRLKVLSSISSREVRSVA